MALRAVLAAAGVIGALVLLDGCPANAPPGAHCKLETTQGVQWWSCRGHR